MSPFKGHFVVLHSLFEVNCPLAAIFDKDNVIKEF